jgi:Phage terminase large subunit (GpA)
MGSRKRRLPVLDIGFANESELHIRAAFHSADAVRGLSADLLLIDEFQDIAEGDLPVLQETLSHSAQPRIIITGTPKLIDNHLESVFRQSTACEWLVRCAGCRHDVSLDERVLGPSGLKCPTCGKPLDPRRGRWAPRNSDSRWGEGYWINHLMVPWLTVEEVLSRQESYDPAKFKNECLGLPTALGDQIITREEIEACCANRSLARTLADVPTEGRRSLFAGIDWGGGGASATVLVIGYIRKDLSFLLQRFDRFTAQEDPDQVLDAVAQRCREFQVQCIAADGGGNGHVYNRLLRDKLQYRAPLYAILYSASDQEPRQDGSLWKWTVNRSASIGAVFSRIKKQLLQFPRAQDCGSFLDEFTCELAEYDNYSRTIRYTHPETQQDDALHATNYAKLTALRWASSHLRQSA